MRIGAQHHIGLDLVSTSVLKNLSNLRRVDENGTLAPLQLHNLGVGFTSAIADSAEMTIAPIANATTIARLLMSGRCTAGCALVRTPFPVLLV
jgi:hypothetical protein